MRGGGGDCRDPFLQGLSLCLQITLPAPGKASAEASSRIISLETASLLMAEEARLH